jgi:tRNA(Met) C34 N-acetyltransferase TmcA
MDEPKKNELELLSDSGKSYPMMGSLIKQYYETLGLEHWDEFRSKAEARNKAMLKDSSVTPERALMHQGRQTGKTTYLLALSIARAVTNNSPRIVVRGISKAHEKLLVEQTKAMLEKLGIQKQVVASRDNNRDIRLNDENCFDHLIYSSGQT